MSDDQEKSGTFKVVDRRRFDDIGNERADEVKPVASVADKAAKVTTASVDATSSQVQEEGYDFTSFVISLGTQALMQLGAMPPPDGISMPRDLNAAKQTIDILAMLQQKTVGNLEPDEQKIMDDILHNLRMAFIKINRQKA